jgi:tRNA(fMet)-specific endonuclease VapC
VKDDDVTIPAVVVAEFLAGVFADHDPHRRAAQRAYLDDVLGVTPVENYGPAVAEHHAELVAHVRRVGRGRGSHDLIIAATARATRRTLVTTDKRAGFEELPDVRVRVVST